MEKRRNYIRGSRLAYAFLIALGITILGCNEDTPSPTSPPASDEYYVKYEAYGSTIYFGGSLNVVLKDESGSNRTLVINTRSKWEYTIGPVKKGFESYLRVTEIEDNYGQLKLSAQISVSKNGSAFAVKKVDDSSTPRTSVTVSYIIDY